MKNTRIKFKTYANPLKPAIFSFSKWNTLHLQAKIQKHGNVSAYLDYLIERYSYRIYQGYANEFKESSFKNSKIAKENLLIKCEIYESTLIELLDLAKLASLSKRSMFQLLIAWDINPPKPSYTMAV